MKKCLRPKPETKTYIILYIYKTGNGYALVNAYTPNQAESIFRTLTSYRDKYQGLKVILILESKYPGDETQLIEEGSVNTSGKNAYDLAVLNGFTGTYEEFMASLKGEPGRDIVSIIKTSTDGLVDTYTITYSSGTPLYEYFTIRNGATKTSELTNDSNFILDSHYVHTDNNYTSAEKSKLNNIQANAEVNVQADWNVTNSASDAFIKNKPNNIVTDASYVHTDNNYTTEEKNKLAGIASGAEVNVQSDWNQTTTTADDYIKNKPTNVSSFNNDAGYLTEHLDISGKLDVIPDLATIRAGAAAGATAYQKPSTGIPKSDLSSSVLTSLGKADTALQLHQDLSSYADGAEYDSTNHLIYLKHGSTRLSNPINANDFIKDGMVEDVEITNGNLVISFNTDAGLQPISIPISDIFDANNYYNKTESDARYLLSFTETDPIFSASPAAGITSSDINYWDNKLNKITPPVVGSLYRNDVGGSGGISIRGTKGLFPTVTSADTYTVVTKMLSSTQSYGLSVNFGGNTYTLNTTNGLIEDTRQITVNAGATWSGSVVGTVAANTIIDIKLFSSLDEITTVGITAITNSYNDLDNKPTIPTAANNGKLTILLNGTTVLTFTANQSSNVTANITVPTKVSDLTNDSGFITGYTETDPVYSASVAAGITSSDISNWNSKTSNIGTITGITMNGTSKGTSGVVNLGTVVTSETDPVFTASAAHGITSSDITNWNNKLDSYTETDPTVPSWAKQSTKPSYSYNEISGTPTLATVATSGSYNDLSNKPTIPTVPTNVSAFTNDAGYLTTHLDISGKQDVLTAGDGIAIDNSDTIRTTGIPYGECDSTSTATAFTATVPGIYKLEDGVCCLLKNGVVTSASGFTIDVNGLGAKPSYSNMATGNPVTPTDPTRDTTIFNINYVMLFIYSETIVSGGGWICYRGYDANTNTIGYQVRTNSSSLPTTLKFYRYRLLFTSADGSHYVPANTSTSTNATASRTVNQTPINPFGPIVYYGTTSAVEAEARPSAAQLWIIYTLTLGYSFNRTGAALTLTSWKPVYIKCAPQANGSAIIDDTTPYVQDLPSTNDGKIYIFLGVAYAATTIELYDKHPVYYHDGSGIRLWTGKDGYTKSEVDAALSGKQATLVSGTNLKTVNSTSLLGSGNVSVQPTLVSGTNIKTINNESLLGSGNITIQGGGGSDWNISVSNNILTISNQN